MGILEKVCNINSKKFLLVNIDFSNRVKGVLWELVVLKLLFIKVFIIIKRFGGISK